MSAKPHLRVVDDQGEIRDFDSYVLQLEDEIAGMAKELRAWRTRYANLARDKEAEAEGHDLFPVGKQLFDYWRERCNHPKAHWTADRFFLALPYLKRDGLEICKLGVDGMASQPFTKEVGGYLEVFDDFETLFKKRGTFERLCNRGARARRQRERKK